MASSVGDKDTAKEKKSVLLYTYPIFVKVRDPEYPEYKEPRERERGAT